MRSSKSGPDFIGVGPEKTGTSWLDTQLREHPNVWVPPVKELRYFVEKNTFPDETFWDRMNSKKSWHREQYVEYTKDRLKSICLNPIQNILFERKRLIWDFRYIMLRHNDNWYLSCFENDPNKISGEISPQYFFSSLSQIESIHKLLPNCKILITLRQPIDWVWSFAKMAIKNGHLQKRYGTLDVFIDSKINNCSFSKSLANWKSFYPDKQILVLFYDNLNKEPWEYYKKICFFLGITPDDNRKSKVKERVNVGGKEPLPNWLIEKVKNGWNDDIQVLSSMVSDLPASWINWRC